MAKRRLKPKTLLLTDASQRSVARVMAALALTEGSAAIDVPALRRRAETMLGFLRRLA